MKKVRSVCVDILKKGSVMKNAKGGDEERRKESREAGIELYIEGRIAKRREESNIPRTLRVRCRQRAPGAVERPRVGDDDGGSRRGLCNGNPYRGT